MRVLIVGSGGREHALAWKVAQSPRLSRLYIAPGNAGTARLGENVPVRAEGVPGLVALARERNVDLVIIGPEAPLAAGLADALRSAGIPAFGPSRAAAQLEASKAFAKAFMARHQIPSARYAAFADYDAAARYVHTVDLPIVIKASGLAAGKGVVLPDSVEEAQVALRRLMREHEFGAAGDEVVIEERLAGEEVSLLAFTDGVTVRPMPPAQDHKRLLDGDQGPNTGGMGAFAPAAALCPPARVPELARRILQAAVDGLRAEGTPFVGVIYAGLMLTRDGPRVLEFNCRFGDPEAQAILPLLDYDLLEVVTACLEGRLADLDIRWKAGAAACVVVASQGYPAHYPTGHEIRGLDELPDSTMIFHAGTQRDDGRVITAGGRVLGVTGWGPHLSEALARAYAALERVAFEGMCYRKDIGRRAEGGTG